MIFKETSLPGVLQVELDPIEDERGFFARSFCRREFEGQGITFEVAQCNISYNRHAGTLRGMHYQAAPYEEAKLVSCLGGALMDVVLDLRDGSPTQGQWLSLELSREKRNMLYIPTGFAHGFQTLSEHTEVLYLMSQFYYPEYSRGVRWDDPAFGIEWPPATERIVSAKDWSYPLWKSQS